MLFCVKKVGEKSICLLMYQFLIGIGDIGHFGLKLARLSP